MWNGKGDSPGGFTFLELLLVLLILGFTLLLSFPNFGEFLRPADPKRAVLSLVGTLRYAQSQSATTKRRHRLYLDLRENAYWVSREGEKGKFIRDPSSFGQISYLPAGISFLDVSQPERGKVTEGTVFVELSPTGWAESSAIHLQREESAPFTIFIHPLGGKAEVQAGYMERWKE
ncbi:MAG: hypothetical protein HY697_03950 [Deltaproteobacteria bacterium]|nr:hypothetical protein [Deltaproteobacteria bacterium]